MKDVEMVVRYNEIEVLILRFWGVWLRELLVLKV